MGKNKPNKTQTYNKMDYVSAYNVQKIFTAASEGENKASSPTDHFNWWLYLVLIGVFIVIVIIPIVVEKVQEKKGKVEQENADNGDYAAYKDDEEQMPNN